jgi:hypothetical protein
MKHILAAILFLVLVACEPAYLAEDHKVQQDRQQQAIDQCIKLGGVPIFSKWDGTLVDCKCVPDCSKRESE